MLNNQLGVIDLKYNHVYISLKPIEIDRPVIFNWDVNSSRFVFLDKNGKVYIKNLLRFIPYPTGWRWFYYPEPR